MKKILTYEISEIVPYINWLYFYHAWGLSGKSQEDKLALQEEALAMLAKWEGIFHTHAIFRILPANSDEDDILIYPEDDFSNVEVSGKGAGDFEMNIAKGAVRLAMLRQQKDASDGQCNLCLSDFIRPMSSGREDKIGLFCATVDGEITEKYKNDEYQSMLAQTLCDRLAEATAERMHEQVRRQYWGYAPNERLTIEQLRHEEYQGIRPAVGYPSMPDAGINFVLDELLDMRQVNVRLTEAGMMTPHASVSGLMFAHPKARYFDVGKIGEDQLKDYARRRGIPLEMMRRFLQSSLIKR